MSNDTKPNKRVKRLRIRQEAYDKLDASITRGRKRPGSLKKGN